MLTKTIKLDEVTYRRLDAIKVKGQTFSEAVDFLLTLHEKVGVLVHQIATTGQIPPPPQE